MILMAIGIYGLLTRHHLLKVLISIELIATAASMNFILLASSLDKALGEAFLVLAFSTDTCVTGIVLALFIIVSKKYGISDLRKLVDIGSSAVGEDEKDGSETGGDEA
jgi:NADH:ubiquinone oxidoreductase subunit K